MFKIFYNNKILLLSESETGEKSYTKINFLSEDKIKNELNIFLKNDQSENLNIYGKDFVTIPDFILDNFIKINAAGGVVLDKSDKMLFIRRLGYYDLPKGKLEAGESTRRGAIREVCEECGILERDLLIEKALSAIYHIYPLKGKFVLKETNWFLMRFSGDYQLSPQTEENITEVGWMDKSRLQEFKSGTYPSLVSLIELF